MSDYSKSIIYTIKTGDSLYVGSTCNFSNREYDHNKRIYHDDGSKYNLKLYKTIRENGYIWNIKPYKEYPCNDIIELELEEERIRQLLNADLNGKCCRTGLSRKDYQKKYRDKNKEKTIEYHKEYYNKNKDKLMEQVKKYSDNNKVKINERNAEQIKCECGCNVARSSLSRHKKSKKHIELIKKN